jgi:hypothetical protein
VGRTLRIARREGAHWTLGYLGYRLGPYFGLDILMANRSLEAKGKFASRLAEK